MRLQFFNSAVIANSKMDYCQTFFYQAAKDKGGWGSGGYCLGYMQLRQGMSVVFSLWGFCEIGNR